MANVVQKSGYLFFDASPGDADEQECPDGMLEARDLNLPG